MNICGFGDTDFTVVDAMEMPVLCDCGKWVELNDTLLPPGESSGETVCRECYEELLEQREQDCANWSVR